ncbi:hypothetical protein SAMN05442782_1794 [Streptomyces sp. OK228]|nr:hypothetical protein SAMN05442782_1794 [Streptomyces sp. OK228]
MEHNEGPLSSHREPFSLRELAGLMAPDSYLWPQPQSSGQGFAGAAPLGCRGTVFSRSRWP